MDGDFRHPRSPIDTEPVHDGSRFIPAVDLMNSVDAMMGNNTSSGSAPVLEITPVDLDSPLYSETTSSTRLVSPMAAVPMPNSPRDFPRSPAPAPLRNNYTPVDEGGVSPRTDFRDDRYKRPREANEDSAPKKRRMYVPPPTGNFVNALESLDYDVPTFSRMDTDLRQDWLDKMQTSFVEIHKNYKHFPNVVLGTDIDHAYLRRQFIRLKNMSDATLVETWIYRLKVVMFGLICGFEFTMKNFFRVDIGPFAETCMNPEIMPYFEAAFKTIYKRYFSGTGGAGDMNPWLLLSIVLAVNFVISLGIGYVQRNYSGMEGTVTSGVNAFIRFLNPGQTAAPVEVASGEPTSLPTRAGSQQTIFGQDPMSLLRKASSFFGGTNKPTPTESKRSARQHHHHKKPEGTPAAGSGSSSFAF